MPSAKIQAYVGDGKGKTTAALGLLLRFLGSGGRACLIQFDKGKDGGPELYSERALFPSLSGLTFHPTGSQRFDPAKQTFRFKNIPADFAEASRGLQLAQAAFEQGFGLIILDEILSLLLTGLVQEAELHELLDRYERAGRPAELVLTGHKLPEALASRMDLITEMRKQKHYFDQQTKARKGIEF